MFGPTPTQKIKLKKKQIQNLRPNIKELESLHYAAIFSVCVYTLIAIVELQLHLPEVHYI